jgi:hypothetical protein
MAHETLIKTNFSNIVSIDVVGMQNLISLGLVSPNTSYRIFDAGVTNGSPGDSSDDGISGFYTKGLNNTTIDTAGSWMFYPNAKSRCFVTYFLSQNSSNDPTDIISIDINGVVLNTTSFTWTPGDDSTSFASSIQADINSNSSISNWSCESYKVYDVPNSASGISYNAITLLFESVNTGNYNGLTTSTNISSPTNPSIDIIYETSTEGGADDTVNIVLEASYDIDSDVFINVYDKYSNVRINAGNSYYDAIHYFPWRASYEGNDATITNTTINHSSFKVGWGIVYIDQTSFDKSSFGGKGHYAIGYLDIKQSSFDSTEYFLSNTSDNVIIDTTDFLNSTIRMSCASYPTKEYVDINISQSLIKSTSIDISNCIHYRASFLVCWSKLISSKIVSIDTFRQNSRFIFNGYSMESSEIEFSTSVFDYVNFTTVAIGEDFGEIVTELKNSKIILSDWNNQNTLELELQLSFLGVYLFNSQILLSGFSSSAGIANFSFTGCIIQNSVINLEKIKIKEGSLLFNTFSEEKSYTMKFYNSTINFNEFDVADSIAQIVFAGRNGKVCSSSIIDFSSSQIKSLSSLDITIDANLESSVIYFVDTTFDESSYGGSFLMDFQGSLSDSEIRSSSAFFTADSIGYSGNYFRVSGNIANQSSINIENQQFYNSDILLDLNMFKSNLQFVTYSDGFKNTELILLKGNIINSNILVSELSKLDSLTLDNFDFTNNNGTIKLSDSTSSFSSVYVRNASINNRIFTQHIKDTNFDVPEGATQSLGLFMLGLEAPSVLYCGTPLGYIDTLGNPISGTVSIGLSGPSATLLCELPSSDFEYTSGPILLNQPNILTINYNEVEFKFDGGGIGGTVFGSLDFILSGSAIFD